jgi:hypothetical protein
LDNQGTITVGTALTINKGSADHANSGTIDVSGGDLSVTQSAITPTFTNSGPLTIATGRTVSVTGGELIYDGGLSGGGTLSLSSNLTATLNADLSNASVVLGATSTTFNGPGSLIDAAGKTLTLTSCTINAPLDNEGTLIVQGTSAVNGAFTSGTGDTLRVQGNPAVGASALTFADGFTNNGTVELTTVGGSSSASLAVTNGTLVNDSTRTIDVLVGSGGGRTLTAQLDNQGTLSVGTALTINKASADHVSSGTIDVSGGNLTLTQSGTTPTFTNSGPLTIAASRTLTATGGTVTNAAAGVIRGAGTLNVSGTTFSNEGTVSPGVSPAILSVTGNCPFSATATLEIEAGGIIAGTDYDRLAVSGTATLAGTLDIAFSPGFCPASGDSFRVLTAGVRAGTFSAINVSGEGNAVLDPQYDATGLTLVTLSNSLAITASAGPGGAISPSGAVAIDCGSSHVFTITPDSCHQIADVLVDGISVGPVSQYTFTNATTSHTISASFALKIFTITASAGTGGTITPSGAVPVGCSAGQSFTIAPGAGFQISGVLVDGSPVGAVANYSFTNVMADHTIAAAFRDVAPPSVEVVVPNGGEMWNAQSVHTIRWTASDNVGVDSVNVDYSIHGLGGPWLPIQHGVAGVDSVVWTIPNVGTDSAAVRARAYDAAANNATDLSNGLFRIVGPTGVSSERPPAALALRLAPNPAGASPVHLRVSLPGAGEAAVEVFTVSGQRLWKARLSATSPGEQDVIWGGRDSGGNDVAAGVYFVRLLSPWGQRTERLVLLR